MIYSTRTFCFIYFHNRPFKFSLTHVITEQYWNRARAYTVFLGPIKNVDNPAGQSGQIYDRFSVPCVIKHLLLAVCALMSVRIRTVTLGSNFTVRISCQVSFCRYKICGLELVFSVVNLDFRAVDQLIGVKPLYYSKAISKQSIL